MLELSADSSVIVLTENTARIRGDDTEIAVTHHDGTAVSIIQDGEVIAMTRDEAEALFLVLDTMLHPEEE